jgi:hypothetical protein
MHEASIAARTTAFIAENRSPVNEGTRKSSTSMGTPRAAPQALKARALVEAGLDANP